MGKSGRKWSRAGIFFLIIQCANDSSLLINFFSARRRIGSLGLSPKEDVLGSLRVRPLGTTLCFRHSLRNHILLMYLTSLKIGSCMIALLCENPVVDVDGVGSVLQDVYHCVES